MLNYVLVLKDEFIVCSALDQDFLDPQYFDFLDPDPQSKGENINQC